MEKKTFTVTLEIEATSQADLLRLGVGRLIENRNTLSFQIIEKGDWKQWIADVYHCSGCWGQKTTDEEMMMELVETRMQADPDDYVPDPSLYRECAAYWNDLCDRYPN